MINPNPAGTDKNIVGCLLRCKYCVSGYFIKIVNLQCFQLINTSFIQMDKMMKLIGFINKRPKILAYIILSIFWL